MDLLCNIYFFLTYHFLRILVHVECFNALLKNCNLSNIWHFRHLLYFVIRQVLIFRNICIFYTYHDALLLKVSHDIIWSVILDNVFSLKRLISPATQKSRIENIAWSVAGAIFGVFPLMLISLCLYISNRKGKPVYSLRFNSRLFSSQFCGWLQQIHFFK